MATLTKKQRETVEKLARNKSVTGFYVENSISGKSATLRYTSRWVEVTTYPYWQKRERHATGMVFSVKIGFTPDGLFDPKDEAKFDALCTEAKTLFNEIKLHEVKSIQEK